MHALNLPTYAVRLRNQNGRNQIFDEVRKKWLVCTPEEWVRQHFIRWLITEKNYPASNIAIEVGLKLNTLQKRTDVVAFCQGQTHLLVECKAPEVKISQKTFDQLFRYNLEVKAPFLAVTNGLSHFFAEFNSTEQRIIYLENLPNYPK